MTALVTVRGRVKPRQRVLVVGARRRRLVRRTAGQGDGRARHRSLQLGEGRVGARHRADDVIDYTREDFADGTRQFDLIIDTAGRRALSRLRRVLAPEGVLVIVCGEGGGRWLGGFQRQLGARLRSMGRKQKLVGLMYRETPDLLLALTELIEAGKLTPVIDRTYPLNQAAEAIRHLERGHAAGKLVLTVP
jgi:NADPH:quinone reductase-like Zn-dependent oxidoreductase